MSLVSPVSGIWPRDGEGRVTRFDVDAEFASRYPGRQAGGNTILELWVPAEEREEFDAHLCGPITLVRSFLASRPEGSISD